ncbi:hypothetical protein DVH05_011292 [Phytophthora capsici]|nr:hypothetical protein DVH05_011292 [Phytophthora capsici]
MEAWMRVQTPIEGDENLKDPGDVSDGAETLRLWEDFFDEVFEDTAAETARKQK